MPAVWCQGYAQYVCVSKPWLLSMCTSSVCVCSVSVVTVNRLVGLGTVPHMTSFVVKCCVPHDFPHSWKKLLYTINLCPRFESICVHASQVSVTTDVDLCVHYCA